MFRKIYLSPLGILISLILNAIASIHKPFMVYGFFNKSSIKYMKRTRVSSSAIFVNKKNIEIDDNVWIGHYCLLDGIGGIKIGKGVHVASHSCIYTHSSQNAIRLMGDKYIEIPAEERLGYIIENVEVGEFSFIGTSCVILPGTKIGNGCILGAGSIVKGEYPDYSIIAGNPAKIIGNTQTVDKKLLENPENSKYYYNPDFIKNK